MMHNSKTRLLSLFLTFVMLLGVIPVPAMAAGPAGSVTLVVNDTAKDDNAARVEGAEYKTVKGAVDKAQSGDTIKLGSNITTPDTESRTFSKSFTFDFNGYTMTCSYNQNTSYGLYISGNNSVLTITDSSENKTGKMVIQSGAEGGFLNTAIASTNGGKVVIDYCTIVAPAAAKAPIFKNFYALHSSATAEVRGTLNVEGIWSEESLALGGNLYAISCGSEGAAYVGENAVVNAPNCMVDGDRSPVWFTPSSGKNLICKGTAGTVAIPLIADMTLTENSDSGMLSFLVPSDVTVTLDLNGHNLSGNQINIIVGGKATLRITNGSNTQSTISNGTANAHNIRNRGDLTIDGKVKIVNRSDKSAYACIYQEGDSFPDIPEKPVDYKPNIAKSVLNQDVILDANYAAMYVDYSYQNSSFITINGSTLSSQKTTPMQVPNGNVTINGATFIAPQDSALTSRIEGFFAGTNTIYEIKLPVSAWWWLENVPLHKFNNVSLTARDNGVYLDERLQSGDNKDAAFAFSNIALNKGKTTPAKTGIMNLSGKDITLSGKDTYFVCKELYATKDDYDTGKDAEGNKNPPLGHADPAGTLTITGGIFSVDPKNYVPDTNGDGIRDYAILDYANKTVSNYFLVAPWTKVGTDNKVTLYYADNVTDTTVASDTVAIDANNDIEHVVTDNTRVQPRHFTLSSKEGEFKAIDGLTVTGFSGTRLTVQKTKACNAKEAYVWYGGKSVGRIVLETNPSYEVGGDVGDSDNTKLENVKIELTQGSNTIYGPVYTDKDGKYQFTKVRPGIYNLVATTVGGKIVTRIITVVDKNLSENLTMPKEERNSILEVKGNDTPAVVVGNLDVIADGYVFGSGENKVVINLTVEKVNEGATGKETSHADIRSEAEALHPNTTAVILFLDAILEKQINDGKPFDIGDANDKVLEVVIPFDLDGKDNIEVFRNHDKVVEKFTVLNAKPTGTLADKTCFIDYDANLIHVYAQKYSDYAITYTKSSFDIISSAGAGGSISPSGKVSVKSGDGQTFTITPNSGYKIADVLVDGVSVGAVSSYQFTSIKADHTIAASFTAIGSSGGDTEYRLSYETNGGNAISPAWYSHGVTVKLDKVPYKSGYLFTGWYADKGLTQKVTEVTMRQDCTVYAGWRQSTIPAMLNGEDHFAYVAGYTDGTVQPLENIARAEVAMIFYRLLTNEVRQKYETSENSFTDVSEDAWYNTAISTMAALGVVKGRSAKIFSPNDTITRAEFAAICARFDDSQIGKESDITDISGHWAEDDIVRAVNLGWCKGYGDKTFRPDNSITRAEAMTMINSVLCRIPENTGDLLQGMRVWPDNNDVNAWYYLAVQEATNGHDYIRKPGGIYEKWTNLQP